MSPVIEEVSLSQAAETQFGKRLNIGCGRDIKPGWINIDRQDLPGVDLVADLERLALVALPFENDSVDGMLMSHVIEHITNVLPMMEELYRVAKPDAELAIRCPYGSSDDADEDPTHVRRMFHGSFLAFSQPYYWRADYGYRGDWAVGDIQLLVPHELHRGAGAKAMFDRIQHRRNQVVEMVSTLRAMKPRRAAERSLMTPCNIAVHMVNSR